MVVLQFPQGAGAEESLNARLAAVRTPFSANDASIVVADEAGNVLYSLNPDKALKPASVLKVLTTIAALEKLGSAYTFKTCAYTPKKNSSSIELLSIKGGGDPGFAIEDAYLLARAIWKRGIREIKRVQVDDSLFIDNRSPEGQRAYQTGSSALAFNYNSIGFQICPTSVGQSALVSIDPWEIGVKLNGAVKTISKNLGRVDISEAVNSAFNLRYSISGTIGAHEKCAIMYRSVNDPPSYFGATFVKVLSQVGVVVTDGFEKGRVPDSSDSLYCQESRAMDRVVQDLNHFSNNFIAEQLLFALGAQSSSEWSREAGLRTLESFLKELGLWKSGFVLSDASGLSHENRLSSRAIVGLLSYASARASIRPEFETSLSIDGLSGTLKKRSIATGSVILRGKTGTIDGVSTLAGYLVTRSGRKFSFAILQNGVQSRQRALAFEDKFLKVLSEF